MKNVKRHAIKILMVSVIGFGLTGCIGSLCNTALGSKTTSADGKTTTVTNTDICK